VEKHVEQVRRNAGIKVISKWESARPAVRALRAGELLCLLPDQRAGKGEGLLLPMFGRVTRFYSSVAQLAMLSGAPVVPGFGVRREPWLSDGRIIACIEPGLQLNRTLTGSVCRVTMLCVRERSVLLDNWKKLSALIPINGGGCIAAGVRPMPSVKPKP
jgi:hypothetical protein